MNNHNIYLYGMITCTNAVLLHGDFPQADGYSEIKEKFVFPGGETGVAAAILTSLGCKVKMDGNYLGFNTRSIINKFYENIGVDISRLHYDPDYEGTEEIIIIGKNTRTAFGQFTSLYEDYYSKKIIRWNTPIEEDIKGVTAAGIDPFFGGESILAAHYCHKNNVPFVTIDVKFDHAMCKLASIIAVSSDWIRDSMPEYYNDEGKIKLHKKYTENTNALVIFTGGSGTTVYGRRGWINKIDAYKVNAVSTLSAGDTFKAGCIYGLSLGWDDNEIIKFSTACAAAACTRFPLPFNPVKLEDVMSLL
ncbi:MAG: carbohydrate kinase family protein [Treponema sp.]|nr:carbohydrate kinase family protein [Treponema sp.]